MTADGDRPPKKRTIGTRRIGPPIGVNRAPDVVSSISYLSIDFDVIS